MSGRSVFATDDIRWLAYCLATAFHETAATMEPIPEYGEGGGKPYGQPVGLMGSAGYGRGYVQLTWIGRTTRRASEFSLTNTASNVRWFVIPIECSSTKAGGGADPLSDGSIDGWFTGVKLGDYFNAGHGGRLQRAPCHQRHRQG